MDDTSPLASLSLTHVYYNPADPISYLCAWLALVPQALCIVYATLIWSTREAEVALMFAGQLACEGANFALKRLIKEERPRRIHLTGKGYGMPSSHAQFAFFWAVALALFLLVRHRPRGGGGIDEGAGASDRVPRGKHERESEADGDSSTVRGTARRKGTKASNGPTTSRQPTTTTTTTTLSALGQDIERYAHQSWSLLERAAVSGIALGVAAAVAWSRVYLGYHTPRQVMAGCVAGALSAAAWFAVTCVARQVGLLAWALDLPLARWFRVRDLVVEEDLCQAGWEKWEGRRRVAGGKKAS